MPRRQPKAYQEVPQSESQEEGLQELTHPRLESNQSKKSINDKEPTSMNNLAQD